MTAIKIFINQDLFDLQEKVNDFLRRTGFEAISCNTEYINPQYVSTLTYKYYTSLKKEDE